MAPPKPHPPGDLLQLESPALIHQVLVSQASKYTKLDALQITRRLYGRSIISVEGEAHKARRQFLGPFLQPRRIEHLGPTVIDCTRRVLAGWADGQSISAGSEMGRLALLIFAEALFGTRLSDQETAEVRAAVKDFATNFRRVRGVDDPHLGGFCQELRARLDSVVNPLIDEHRRCPKDDLLGRMVEECDKSGTDDQLLRNDAVAIFLVGHDTSTHAMAWVLYLLSRHPEDQDRIREELGSTELRAEDMERLPLLRAAILEAMRLYPPAWMLGRETTTEVDIGDDRLPAHCRVTMSQYAMHRKEEIFEQPDRFWIDRWSVHPRQNLPKVSYFPFGAGPRVCIGEHFAWLEMMLGLGTILQECRLGMCPVGTPKIHLSLTLVPDEELMIPIEFLRPR